MTTAAHAEAMRRGRAAQLARDNAERKLAHEAYSAWVREDARCWRDYLTAVEYHVGVDLARDAWQANARLMPAISWATSA